MLSSGEPDLKGEALRFHHESIRTTRYETIDGESGQINPPNGSSSHDNDTWTNWVSKESQTRLRHCVWVRVSNILQLLASCAEISQYLDRLISYQFEIPATLRLGEIHTQLPGHDEAWACENLDEWQENTPTAGTNRPALRACSILLLTRLVDLPSLASSLQVLYTEKQFDKALPEFSRTLLVHALLQHMEEIAEQQSQPLTSWTPTSKKLDKNSRSIPTEPVWLPGIASYSRWRNATCDCLDVLHCE